MEKEKKKGTGVFEGGLCILNFNRDCNFVPI